VQPEPLIQLTNLAGSYEWGVLTITLHPDFATNGYYYLFYVANSPLRARVSRFTASGNSTVAGSETVIWQSPVAAGVSHHGGGIAFDAQGKLFLATGDNFETSPVSQDITSNSMG